MAQEAQLRYFDYIRAKNEYDVTGRVLTLSSAKYPNQGRRNNFSFEEKIITENPGIEHEAAWLVVE